MNIKQVIDPGELSIENAKTSDKIISAACWALDNANAADICGVILFQGEDGKFYTGATEFSIAEADPEFVVDTLTSEYAKCATCGHIQYIDLAEPSDDDDGECLCDKCNHTCFEITRESLK